MTNKQHYSIVLSKKVLTFNVISSKLINFHRTLIGLLAAIGMSKILTAAIEFSRWEDVLRKAATWMIVKTCFMRKFARQFRIKERALSSTCLVSSMIHLVGCS